MSGLAVAGGQDRVDAIQAAVRGNPVRRSIRRENVPPLDPALVPTDDLLSLRIAEELEYARRVLDQMGDLLAGDGLLIARYGQQLQNLDVVGQTLTNLASVIRSSAPERAVDRIGMAELKGRLRRASLR